MSALPQANPSPEAGSDALIPAVELERMRRRWERERATRQQAEAIAECALRDLYVEQRHLHLLKSITSAANQAQSFPEVLRYALGQICTAIDWPIGHVYMAEHGPGGLRLSSAPIWREYNGITYPAFRDASEIAKFKPGEGLPGRVLSLQRPLWVYDVGTEYNFPRQAPANDAGLKAAFAFPVVVGEEVAAVLELFARRPLPPDHNLLALMTEIGAQLARVSERKHYEERLVHDASHDPLTGLPNRTLFLDRLARAVSRHKRYPEFGYAVLFVDLDRFKVVNDGLGHHAGDRMLLQVGERLSGALRQGDESSTLARLGGDEFTILLEDLLYPSDAVRVAERIQQSFAQPFRIDQREIYTSTSIGITSSAGGYESAEQVLRDADLAMYRAKSQGKARYEVFDEDMHALAVGQLALESDLRHALQMHEFVVHYQPIVDLKSGHLTGVEALVRWQRGDRLVPPGEFIGVAEDTGLILPLGLWVLREACTTMHRWHQEFPHIPPFSVSVNLSARQFNQPNLVEEIGAILAETGLDPACLHLEITETVMMGDSKRSVELLGRLKNLGVRFSVDDFGTGYSSLSYLHRFPIDVLKIDRSFVSQIGTEKEGLAIIQTILSLARNLGMQIVAEGTETELHVAKLRSLGCHQAQGFYFAKPMSAAELRGHLAQSSRDDAVLPFDLAPGATAGRNSSQ